MQSNRAPKEWLLEVAEINSLSDNYYDDWSERSLCDRYLVAYFLF